MSRSLWLTRSITDLKNVARLVHSREPEFLFTRGSVQLSLIIRTAFSQLWPSDFGHSYNNDKARGVRTQPILIRRRVRDSMSRISFSSFLRSSNRAQHYRLHMPSYFLLLQIVVDPYFWARIQQHIVVSYNIRQSTSLKPTNNYGLN